MIRKFYLKDYSKIPNNVSCIGHFDGVHKGHQKLIKETIKEANKLNVIPCAIIINPTKDNKIFSKKSFKITSLNRRIELLEYFGIKAVVIVELDDNLAKISKEDFVKNYLGKLNIKELICGFDFSYGYKGLGNSKSLKKDAKNLFDVIVVDEVTYYNKKISSTRIKEELNKNNYKLVNKLLGYEYK